MAALSIAIQESAGRLSRQRQRRAELRLDEIVSVAGIADQYAAADRAGDLDVEAHFGRLWRAAETEEMRTLIVQAFAAWTKDEQIEELAVRDAVGDSVALLKTNNDTWLTDGCGPSGRAA